MAAKIVQDHENGRRARFALGLASKVTHPPPQPEALPAHGVGAPAAADDTPSKHGWLYGPISDLLILVGPWLFLLAVFGFSAEAALAVWLGQFVFGNTTHVILTFVMLGTRRDVLHATPKQPRLVIVGSTITFIVTFALLASVSAMFPNWTGFPFALVMLFGMHHRLAQARGIWSLYNLRSKKLGMPPPAARERSFQQHWTSVGLILVAISWLFVPSAPWKSFAMIQAIPLMEAPLPYEAAYALVAVWLLFVGAVLTTLIRNGSRLAKLLHVGTHGAAVTLAILFPVWGSVVWGTIHGLEYYFLCARMMTPRRGDADKGIPKSWVWPVVLLSMLPIFVVGVFNAPFTALMFSETSAFPVYALHAVNALVVAHYFADAFIYRFRIPGVRRVALHRLGFS